MKYFIEIESLRKKINNSDYKEIEDAVNESIELIKERHYARGGK